MFYNESVRLADGCLGNLEAKWGKKEVRLLKGKAGIQTKVSYNTTYFSSQYEENQPYLFGAPVTTKVPLKSYLGLLGGPE